MGLSSPPATVGSVILEGAGPMSDAGAAPGPRESGLYRHLPEAGLVLLVAAAMVGLVTGLARWEARGAVEKAHVLLDRGDYQAAVRTLLPVVTRRPDDARAHYYLGLAYAALGAHAGAISQFRASVRLAPADAAFHEGLGQAYRETGDTGEARREFEEAARLAPDDPDYLIALAGLLLDGGRTEAAIAPLRRAARLRPRAPEIHLLLAAVLRHAGDASGARSEYAEAARLARSVGLRELAHQELRTFHPEP